MYCIHIHTHEVNDLLLNHTFIHTNTLTHTQRWGRQNEVKHRGNKSRGVRLLISSRVHHFKQAETAGEGSAAEQRPSQLGWVMHNGRALHTHTHLGPHSGRQPVLSEVSIARAARCVMIRRGCLGGGWLVGEKQSMMGDVAPCAPPPPTSPSFLFLFFTFILARGCFCGITQGFDRRHPLPVGPLNWAPTSQPGLMCQEAESPLTMNLLALCLFAPQHPPALLGSAPHTPLEQQSAALCSCFHVYLFLIFPHSLTAPLR